VLPDMLEVSRRRWCWFTAGSKASLRYSAMLVTSHFSLCHTDSWRSVHRRTFSAHIFDSTTLITPKQNTLPVYWKPSTPSSPERVVSLFCRK
jgi:hypothetical protein